MKRLIVNVKLVTITILIIDSIFSMPEEYTMYLLMHAVSLKKSADIVGHVPRSISFICTLFLRHDGNIKSNVTGHQILGYLQLSVICKTIGKFHKSF